MENDPVHDGCATRKEMEARLIAFQYRYAESAWAIAHLLFEDPLPVRRLIKLQRARFDSGGF